MRDNDNFIMEERILADMFGITVRSTGEYKLVILVRDDLKMTKGKIAAQAGHAAVNCALGMKKKDPQMFDRWTLCGQPIIVLKVGSEKELFEFKAMADAQNMNSSIITDAGRTEVEPGTRTCMGIGPAPSPAVDKITGELKML